MTYMASHAKTAKVINMRPLTCFLTENGVDLFHVGLRRKQHECLPVGTVQDLKQPLHALFNEGFVFLGRLREIVAVLDHGVFIVWILSLIHIFHGTPSLILRTTLR